MNYADETEESKGTHIIDQKNEFERELYKYFDKFGDEMSIDTDPV